MTKAPYRMEGMARQTMAFLARVRHVSGALITTSNTSAVTVTIWNDRTGTTLAETPLTPLANYISNMLVTDDPRWRDDANDDDADRGYNFEYRGGVSSFPEQAFYRVEFKFTDVAGEVTKNSFEGPMRSTSEP